MSDADPNDPGRPETLVAPDLHGLNPGELLARGLKPISFPLTEIVIFIENQEIARHVLATGAHVFGRSEECNVQVEAALVSREHARLTVTPDGSLLLEDLSSTNGTFLDGNRISGLTPVEANQTIQIGVVQILVLQGIAGAVGTPTKADEQPVPGEFASAIRYEPGLEIAKGGMGAVLSARQPSIRRDVAMKVMLQDVSAHDRLRFIEEAQITGQLEHPNIVPVHELATNERAQPYYTMKLVKGITLKKILDLLRQGTSEAVAKYPLAALLTIFQKVSDAIAFAHSKGVIHRDLKPPNIMVGDYGEVLVMDWGLAKFINRDRSSARHTAGHSKTTLISTARRDHDDAFATLDGAVMGTPRYMSPEQARGEIATLDERSDVFSLGGILYEIVTLSPPFPGETTREILSRILSGHLDVPSARLYAAGYDRPRHLPTGTVPDSLEAVLLKALAFEPEQRYQRVADLQADLAAYQNGFATRAEKAGPWRQFKLFVARNKGVSISIAAGLVLAASVAAAFMGSVIRERNIAVRERLHANAERGRADTALRETEIQRRRAEEALAIVEPERNRAEQALRALKKTAPTFAALAEARFAEGKLTEALDQIGYALELDSTNPEYHRLRADTLASANKLAEAVAEYRHVLLVRPSDPIAKTNLAISELALAERRQLAESQFQMLAWWKGDGDARDAVGLSHGALMDGASFAAVGSGKAFSLDGTKAYVSIQNNGAWTFEKNDFTIALWVNFSAILGEQSFLASNDAEPNKSGWMLQLNRGHLQLKLDGAAKAQIKSPYFGPVVGRWYHVAVTRTASTIRFYVGGAEVSSEAWTGEFPATRAPLLIGHNQGGPYFNGLIKDVRIYRSALPANKISALAASAKTADEALKAPLVPPKTVPEPAVDGPLPWSGSYIDGLSKAKAEHRPIFLYYAPLHNDYETLHDASVRQGLQEFIWVHDYSQEVSAKFKQGGFPAFLFVDPNNEAVFAKTSGFGLSPAIFMKTVVKARLAVNLPLSPEMQRSLPVDFSPDQAYIAEMSVNGDMEGITAYMEPVERDPLREANYLLILVKHPEDVNPWDIVCRVGRNEADLPTSGVALISLFRHDKENPIKIVARGFRTIEDSVSFKGTGLLRREYTLERLQAKDAAVFRGRVILPNGAAAANAIVRICDWGEVRRTAADGTFSFPAISPGTFKVRGEYPGAEFESDLTFKAGSPLSYDLHLQHITTVGVRWAIQTKEKSVELTGKDVRTGEAYIAVRRLSGVLLERGAKLPVSSPPVDFYIQPWDESERPFLSPSITKSDASKQLKSGTPVFWMAGLPNVGGWHKSALELDQVSLLPGTANFHFRGATGRWAGMHLENKRFDDIVQVNDGKPFEAKPYFEFLRGFPVRVGDVFTLKCVRRDCYAKMEIIDVTQ